MNTPGHDAMKAASTRSIKHLNTPCSEHGSINQSLRVQSTPPRSTKKHTHSISTKRLQLCVQLYNSTTYSKKETNTMNFVFYTPTVVFSAQNKFISATVRLSPAESNSKGVFRRGLYHDVEFCRYQLLPSAYTLSALQKNV